MKTINIYNARQHNLKNISLQIPKNKITVFTGVSGSGKSSLVFDTIGAEAQRQINETQNSFARHRLQHLGIADVDKIEHLNVPVIIDQRRLGGNVRSTVGTVTDIYTRLRLLYSRIGRPFVGYSNAFSFNNPQGMCSYCQGLGVIKTINIETLFDKNKSLNEGAINFHSFQPGGWRLTRYIRSGYFDNDKKLKDYTPEEWETLLYAKEHKPENPDKEWGKTVLYEGVIPRIERTFLKKDTKTSRQLDRSLAKTVTPKACPFCNGARLNKKILSCKINGVSIGDCVKMPIDELLLFIRSIENLTYSSIIRELNKRLENMVQIGLSYLSLERLTGTLSGGESQRIKMVRHLGNSLTDLLYIFDEPSIGLHPKDVEAIAHIIQQLRNKGNTILIVEHDPGLIKIADCVIDMGPAAGKDGGEVIFQGTFKELKDSKGKTGQYFSTLKTYNQHPRQSNSHLAIENCNLHNLKKVSVHIPKHVLTAVTGVAGSGKSSLITQALPKLYPEIKVIDQSRFTASSRSNLLTYLDISDKIRKLFAEKNGVSIQLFSSNSKGACPTCKGLGVQKIDLAFMDDVEEVCEECGGSGFKQEVLNFSYNRKNIEEVLKLTIAEAIAFFRNEYFVSRLEILQDLGLDYLALGQRLATFSGGERQRLKLAKKLGDSGEILVLDEPGMGLHPSDTEKLLKILNRLLKNGNTIILIEHKLGIISKADWVIDVGPGAGKNGGRILFEGTVKDLLACKTSATAKYLKAYLH